LANRSLEQFQYGFKNDMVEITAFVSIGTGGLVNAPDQFGLGTPSAGSVSTGPPRGLLPGQMTAGVPTGWAGGFSGVQGGLKQGIAGIQRVSTGTYAIQLEDDYVALHNCQVQPMTNAPGCTSISDLLIGHTVGVGNSVTTGGLTAYVFPGPNPKNTLWIQFHASGNQVDIPLGGGFYIQLNLKNSFVGNL
jgi:hypothetical protein